jgi:hypothetical protein
MSNETADSAFLKAMLAKDLEPYEILHNAVGDMYNTGDIDNINRLMLLAYGTHCRGYIRCLLMAVKPILEKVDREIFEQLREYIIKKVEEDRKENLSLRLENERLKGWMTMLENAPGEAHETIRERCLSSHYLQPIVGSWRSKVEELEGRIGQLEAALEKLVRAMKTYEGDAEGDAPMEHQEMMNECEGLLPKKCSTSPLCTTDQLKQYYPVRCERCHWEGCSCDTLSSSIADTGEYSMCCPHCYSEDFQEISNERQ